MLRVNVIKGCVFLGWLGLGLNDLRLCGYCYISGINKFVFSVDWVVKGIWIVFFFFF